MSPATVSFGKLLDQRLVGVDAAAALREFQPGLVAGHSHFTLHLYLDGVLAGMRRYQLEVPEIIELATKKTKNAIQVDIQRVDDFGNFQLVSAHTGHNAIKAKVKREVAVPGDKVWLKFPKRRFCVYADEALL